MQKLHKPDNPDFQARPTDAMMKYSTATAP
jgi:hypothetical protein